MGKGRQESVFFTHTIIKIGGEMSICTILVQVLCNIDQIPLETVVGRLGFEIGVRFQVKFATRQLKRARHIAVAFL